MKWVILGGSSVATPAFVEALAERAPKDLELVLYGRDSEKLAAVLKASRVLAQGGFVIRAETQMDTALRGADVVLNQIRAGGLSAREFDERYPTRYGLLGEETLGLGGFFNALRTIRVVTGLVARGTEVAPQATWINLTNPAGLVLRAIHQVSTLRALSVCDMPGALYQQICDTLERPAVDWDYVGVNHLGWVTGISSGGANLMPDAIRRWDPAYPIDRADMASDGVIAAPYCRYWYYPHHYTPESYTAVSRATVLRQLEEHLVLSYTQLAEDADPAEVRALAGARRANWYRQVVVPAMTALTQSEPVPLVIQHVDAAGDVVERPGLLSQAGFRPHPAWAPRPAWLEQCLQQQRLYEAMAVTAILSGDRALAVDALHLNPWVADRQLARQVIAEAWDAVCEGQEAALLPRDR